ncbi:hypothetical protein [Microbacterium sulfonylureivorans]|uniref:hypothetical protein n=1 Tax=Microbacterium sulfonylureivorans TaxID=2486854 RepID=UPI0013DFEACF|nr:hypothetical protein [Microbacterium sulfonylureivorans]
MPRPDALRAWRISSLGESADALTLDEIAAAKIGVLAEYAAVPASAVRKIRMP